MMNRTSLEKNELGGPGIDSCSCTIQAFGWARRWTGCRHRSYKLVTSIFFDAGTASFLVTSLLHSDSQSQTQRPSQQVAFFYLDFLKVSISQILCMGRKIRYQIIDV